MLPDLAPQYADTMKPLDRMGTPGRRARARATANAASVSRRNGNRYNPRPRTGDCTYTAEEEEVLREVIRWRAANVGQSCLSNIDLFRILKGMGYVRIPQGYRVVLLNDDSYTATLRLVSPD